MANTSKSTGFSHEKIETNNLLMIVLIVLVVAVGGIVEIVPLFFQRSTTQPADRHRDEDQRDHQEVAGLDALVTGGFRFGVTHLVLSIRLAGRAGSRPARRGRCAPS